MGPFHTVPARSIATNFGIVSVLARHCGSRLPKSSDFRMLPSFLCSLFFIDQGLRSYLY